MQTFTRFVRKAFRCLIALAVGASAALLAGLLLSRPAWPVEARDATTTVVVSNTNDSGPGSLRAALALSNNGDGIAFDLPSHSTIVLTSGELTVTKSVLIDGASTVSLTVSGNHASRVFSVTAPATFRSFLIENGNSPTGYGGGIATIAAITLDNMIFISNSAVLGGGLFAAGPVYLNGGSYISNTALAQGGGLYSDGVLVMAGTQLLNNWASSGGGGMRVSNAAFITGGLFLGNQTSYNGSGGGLYITGTLNLTGTQFLSNSASWGGGALAFVTATVTGALFQGNHALNGNGGGLNANTLYFGRSNIAGTTFVGNTASGAGGGAELGYPELSGDLFVGNQAGTFGGGLNGGRTTISGTSFITNSAQTYGGGAVLNNSGAITSSLFQENRSLHSMGGGVTLFSNGPDNLLVLNAARFISNSAASTGGGVFVSGAAVELSGGLFEGNSAGSSGGGLFAYTATLNGGLFAGNSAGRHGGALSAGPLALTGTQFFANSAMQRGGGAYAVGSTRIVNALFARNATPGLGAALFLGYTGTSQILHTTIASPTVAVGAAIYVMTATVGVTDTIIAQHEQGIVNASGSVYEDYNLFTGVLTPTAGSDISGPHHPTGPPAFLNPAADNYHLWQGSAAIDTGVNAGVAVDVDGQPRPQAAGFDIGYDESGGTFQSVYLPLVAR